MKNKAVDKFLEENNMTYMFLLLANLEAERLAKLPFSLKEKLGGKITSKALDHIATNSIPDYVAQEVEKTLKEEN
ncbi:MAG: hypothetical protein HN952_00475 [Candidatus Cloacimonetes bacterium]|jgi:hypothetical protein|nr:hypothetical protein [Candidatus Cloacimonadota bacterium]MBT6993409.1 hypothetical protein [Candidatus Cloacimonadota bacterium]MBT7470066.1 hypothetical protein [Candidatus Cloacimonadota bacterium]